MKKIIFISLLFFVFFQISGEAVQQYGGGWTVITSANIWSNLPGRIVTDNYTEAVDIDASFLGLKKISRESAATVILTAADCRGGMFVNDDDDAIDFTLPEAQEGMMVSFYSHFDQIITIDCHANDRIVLDNVKLTDGNAIDSPGQQGNVITLLAISNTSWITFGRSGIWVDGGVD